MPDHVLNCTHATASINGTSKTLKSPYTLSLNSKKATFTLGNWKIKISTILEKHEGAGIELDGDEIVICDGSKRFKCVADEGELEDFVMKRIMPAKEKAASKTSSSPTSFSPRKSISKGYGAKKRAYSTLNNSSSDSNDVFAARPSKSPTRSPSPLPNKKTKVVKTTMSTWNGSSPFKSSPAISITCQTLNDPIESDSPAVSKPRKLTFEKQQTAKPRVTFDLNKTTAAPKTEHDIVRSSASALQMMLGESGNDDIEDSSNEEVTLKKMSSSSKPWSSKKAISSPSPSKSPPKNPYVKSSNSYFPKKSSSLFTSNSSKLSNKIITGGGGLRNMGNTCYMNAAFQALGSLPLFVDRMEGFKGGKLFESVVDVLKGKKKDCEEVKGVMKIRGNEQEDAFEFLGGVVEGLEGEWTGIEKKGEEKTTEIEEKTLSIKEKLALKAKAKMELKTPAKAQSSSQSDAPSASSEASSPPKITPPKDKEAAKKSTTFPTSVFDSKLLTTLKCTTCGFKRTHNEKYQSLSLPLSESLEGSLTDFFGTSTVKLECEKEGCEGGEVEKGLEIEEGGNCILVHLKRFEVVEKEGGVVLRKDDSTLKIPPTLSLTPYLTKNSAQANPTYKLKSIIRHIGSGHSSGHYTTVSKKNSGWVEFNDSIAKKMDEKEVFEGSEKTGYVACYECA